MKTALAGASRKRGSVWYKRMRPGEKREGRSHI